MHTLKMYYVHFVIIVFCIILKVNQCEGRYISYQSNGNREASIGSTSNSHTGSTFDGTNLFIKNVDKLYRTNKRHEKIDINKDVPPEKAQSSILRCNNEEKKGSNESASKSGDSCNKQKPWSHGVFSDSQDTSDGYYCPTESTWLSQESLIKTADPKSEANKWIGGDLLAEKCKKNNEYNCLKIQFAAELGIASVDGWKICGGNSGKCDGRISQYIVLYRNPSSDQWSTFQEQGLSNTPQTFSVEQSGVATEMLAKQAIAQELMFCPLEATGSTPLMHVTIKGCILKKRDQGNKTVVFPGKASSDSVCTSEELWLDMDGQLKTCMFHTNAGGRAADAIFSRAGYSFPNIPLKLEQNDKYYLEVAFPELKAFQAIKVMGGTIGEVQGTVERFKLSYKDTANNGGWVFVQDGKCGADKVYGQRQPSSYASGYYKANRIPLKPPIITTGIRLYPLTWCGDRPVTKVDFKACDVLAKKCGCIVDENKDVPCKTKPEPCARNSYAKTGFTNPMGSYKQLRGKGSNEVQYSVGSHHTLNEKLPLEKLDPYSIFSYTGNTDKQSSFELEPHLQNELHHYLDKSRLGKPKTIEDNDVNYYSKIAKREKVLNYQSLRDQREEQNQVDDISLNEASNNINKKFKEYPTDIVKRDTSYASPLEDQEEINYLSESQEDGIGNNADIEKYLTANHIPTFENQESEARGHQESHVQDKVQFKQRKSDNNVAPLTDQETIKNESYLDEEVSFATNNMAGIRKDELINDWQSNKMHSTDNNQADIFHDQSSIEDETRGEYSEDQNLEARNIDTRTSGELGNVHSEDWGDINEEEATASEYRMERPDVGVYSIVKHTNLLEKANDDLKNMVKQEEYENAPSVEELEQNENGGPNNFFEEDMDDPDHICYEEESEDESSLEDAEAYDYGESSNLFEEAIDDLDRIVKREVSEQVLDKNEHVKSSNTIEKDNNKADKTSILEESESESPLEDADEATNQEANVLDKLSNVGEGGTDVIDESIKVMINVDDKELRKVLKDKTKRALRGAFMNNDANLNPPMVSDGETFEFTDERTVEDSNALSGGTDDLIIIPMKYARNTDIRNLMNEIQEALLKTDN